MLSIHKCPTDKTRLGYVPTSISDTPSTSKTIFVRPVILESPPPRMDKGKATMEEEVPLNNKPLVIDLRPKIMFQSFSSCRSLLKQKRLGSPRRLQQGKSPMKEHLLLVLSCKIWSYFWLYSFRRKDGTRMRTHTPRGGVDLPSR
jgi:hypothetical protein